METIRMRRTVGNDGTLTIPLPMAFAKIDVDVVVVIQPVAPAKPGATPEELGWPPGYFEQTYGSFRDNPLERPDQGEYEVREPLG